MILFLALGSDKPSHRRIQQLLSDLLRCKVQYKCLLQARASSDMSNCKPLKVHQKVAREILCFDRFPVDQNVDSPKAAAWKCGQTVITLRIGSSTSLYRGWIEVVVRSPASHTRRLVKWRTDNVADGPDSLLPFWELLHPSLNPSLAQVEIPPPDEAKQTTPVESQILKDAKNLIEKFDEVVEGAGKQPIGDAAYGRQNSAITKVDNGNRMERVASLNPQPLKRIYSDGDITSTLTLADCDEPTEGSVYSWLQECLEKRASGVELLRELETLGFASEALGFPKITSKTGAPISYSTLYPHQKLKPFKNGSNFNRAISILDRATSFQTHKIALLYGGPFSKKVSQRKKSDPPPNDGNQFLLANQASTDFWSFSKELGDFVPIRHMKYFSGGLDTSHSSSDGDFSIVWFECNGDDDPDAPILVDSMVIFHTVTLMPDGLTNRKRHVGNDIVHIVYGIETDTLDIDHQRLAISGHFGFVTIYVIPFVCLEMDKITIHLKSGLDLSICSALSHLVGSRVVPRKLSAQTVRKLSIESDLICRSMIEDKLGRVLNIEERAKRIHDIDRHLK